MVPMISSMLFWSIFKGSGKAFLVIWPSYKVSLPKRLQNGEEIILFGLSLYREDGQLFGIHPCDVA